MEYKSKALITTLVSNAYYGKQNEQRTDETLISIANRLSLPNARQLTDSYVKTYIKFLDNQRVGVEL